MRTLFTERDDSKRVDTSIDSFHVNKLTLQESYLRIRQTTAKWRESVEYICNKFYEQQKNGTLPSASLAKYIDRYKLSKKEEKPTQVKQTSTHDHFKKAIATKISEHITAVDKLLHEESVKTNQQLSLIVQSLNDAGIYDIGDIVKNYRSSTQEKVQEYEEEIRRNLLAKYDETLVNLLLNLSKGKRLVSDVVPDIDVPLKKFVPKESKKQTYTFPPHIAGLDASFLELKETLQTAVLTEADAPLIQKLVHSNVLVEEEDLRSFDQSLMQNYKKQLQLIADARTSAQSEISFVYALHALLEHFTQEHPVWNTLIDSIDAKSILRVYQLAMRHIRAHKSWLKVAKKSINEVTHVSTIADNNSVTRISSLVILECRKHTSARLSSILSKHMKQVKYLSGTLLSLISQPTRAHIDTKYIDFMKDILQSDTDPNVSSNSSRLALYLVLPPKASFVQDDSIGVALYEMSTEYLESKTRQTREELKTLFNDQYENSPQHVIDDSCSIIQDIMTRNHNNSDMAKIVMDTTRLADDTIPIVLYEDIQTKQEETMLYYKSLIEEPTPTVHEKKRGIEELRDELFEYLEYLCGNNTNYHAETDESILDERMKLLAYDFTRIKLYRYVIRSKAFTAPDTVTLISSRCNRWYKDATPMKQYDLYKKMYRRVHYAWKQDRVERYEQLVRTCVSQLLRAKYTTLLQEPTRIELLRESIKMSENEYKQWRDLTGLVVEIMKHI
jgi:hypothetical protein